MISMHLVGSVKIIAIALIGTLYPLYGGLKRSTARVRWLAADVSVGLLLGYHFRSPHGCRISRTGKTMSDAALRIPSITVHVDVDAVLLMTRQSWVTRRTRAHLLRGSLG